MSTTVPTDFDGIPMFNYNQYCFYRYVNDSKRNEKCFEVLWNLFDAAIKFAEDKSNEVQFKELFEKALLLDLVGLPKLTIGLFQLGQTHLSILTVLINHSLKAEPILRLMFIPEMIT